VSNHRHLSRLGSALIMVLLLIQLLAACGGGQPPAVPTSDEPATSETGPSDKSTRTPRNSEDPTTDPGKSPTDDPGATPVETDGPISEGGILRTGGLQYGVAARLHYIDRDRTLTLANNAGFDWVREQIHWKDIEGPKGTYNWGELDAIVEAANAHNIKLLLSIVRSPEWATANGSDGMPDNPVDLGDFVEAMATHYKGQIQAYEIWNEQNLAHENGGNVVPEDAGRYVELLAEAYTRIKAVDPQAYVIAAPPSSTGITQPDVAVDDITYYRGMYSYENGKIKDFFDAQAIHPGGSANPPDTMWPDNPSTAEGWTTDATFYFRHIEDVRKVMEEYGMDNHPVWITEYGWATENNTPGYEFGNQVSFEQQGDYIIGAMDRVRKHYPWVDVMILWNLNYSVLWADQPLNEQASFAILNPDWSPREAFHKVQAFINAVKQEEAK
jgi:hypothetical protein